MRATDIEKLVSVGRPALASHGGFVVFASSRPDLAANRAVGQLWRIDLPDGTPRRLTRGVADTAPMLSPDDTRLAFLRADPKGKSQLHIVDPAGGEPVQVTDAPLGVLTRIVVDVGEASGVELELSSSAARTHGGFSCPTLMPG